MNKNFERNFFLILILQIQMKKSNTLLYYQLMFLYGASYSLMSLMIPYLVQRYEFDTSKLSWIFPMFGVGGILGGFAYKALNRVLNAYQILTLVCLVVFLINITVYFSRSLLIIYFSTFVFAISIYCLEIGINSCVLDIYKEKSQTYMQKFYSAYGFGVIFLPIMISILSLQVLIVYALIFLWLSFQCYETCIYKKNQHRNCQQQQKNLQQTMISQSAKLIQFKKMNMSVEIWMYLNSFFFISCLMIFQLFPLFGTITNLLDKTTINIILSISLVFFPISKPFFAYLKLKGTDIIKYSCYSLFIVNLISITLLLLGYMKIVILFLPLFVAISTSGNYPILIAMPKEHGIETSDSTISHFFIISAFSYFVCSTLLSSLMESLTPYCLIVGAILFNYLAIISLFFYNKAILFHCPQKLNKRKQQQNNSKLIQLTIINIPSITSLQSQ